MGRGPPWPASPLYKEVVAGHTIPPLPPPLAASLHHTSGQAKPSVFFSTTTTTPSCCWTLEEIYHTSAARWNGRGRSFIDTVRATDPDEIPDITRSSGMVRRIRFIYRMSFYVFENDSKVLWKVLEDMASSINFNQFLEKEKLKSNGSNFTDWFRHVRIFLNGGNLQYVLDAPLGDPPAETETDEVKNVYATRKTRYSQVQCAILCSLEADLQKRFEHHDPHELINELKTIFETHAAVECYEASKHFFSCMMEEGSSVSEHMLAMTGHAKKLKHEQRVPELFAMLKSAEIEIKKEHQVLMVNKTTNFKKQGKSKGKNKKSGKKAATPPVKPKSGPKPDAECYYCKEKGHWKRNCSKYLADLKSGLVKKKKEDHGAPSINFNQFLEKEKLKGNGSNFTDWFRHVRIFLTGVSMQYVLEAPLGPPPPPAVSEDIKNVYETRVTRYSEVQCAILCSLEAELQKRFEHHDPCDMMRELKLIFETHAAVESYEASKQFFNCMMEEGSSVSEHINKKENQVLMVNKTTSFKKQGKPNKGNFKKGGKKVAAPPEKPKAGPKPETVCYYCQGKGHWKRNCTKYLADLKSGHVKKKGIFDIHVIDVYLTGSRSSALGI
ncbi:hypothetical protein QYE76_071607 [Lolium multiflorum]|uniref:CCHC-type domain-containing protein n=1 Tax=Lolium multiflorum TaxID=4521 RepID=A0AAD8SMF0_LOLMU|nr:hypothetical protein QYE76_071607 [Lolium multiflorum]